MKKMLLILGVLAVAASVHAQGIDTSKWLIANDISNGLDQCNFASQTSQAGGYGILTFNYMYEGYSCPGSEGVDFAGGFIITRPFSFTYGVVEARISLGTDEDPLYGAVWMWGGDPTSSGYPPTCTATIAAGIGDTMANCTSTAVNAYEFDICESFLTLDSVGGNSHVWQNANVVLTGGGFHTGSDLATFHVCRLEWSPTAVTWKYDGVVEGTESIVLPPSDVKMAIIIDQEKWEIGRAHV